jgi:hypothetical protein
MISPIWWFFLRYSIELVSCTRPEIPRFRLQKTPQCWKLLRNCYDQILTWQSPWWFGPGPGYNQSGSLVDGLSRHTSGIALSAQISKRKTSSNLYYSYVVVLFQRWEYLEYQNPALKLEIQPSRKEAYPKKSSLITSGFMVVILTPETKWILQYFIPVVFPIYFRFYFRWMDLEGAFAELLSKQ